MPPGWAVPALHGAQAGCAVLLAITTALPPGAALPGTRRSLLLAIIATTACLCALAAVREWRRDRGQARRRAVPACWALLTAAHLAAVAGPLWTYLPLALAALGLLLRDGAPRWLASMWGDAAVTGLGALAIGTFSARTVADRPLTTPALVDISVMALVLAGTALRGPRLSPAASWLAVGIILVTAGDLVVAVTAAHPGETGWLAGGAIASGAIASGAIAAGVAAAPSPWLPRLARERRARPRATRRLGTLPWLFTGASAGIIAIATTADPASAVAHSAPPVSVTTRALALGCLCAAFLRVALTLLRLDGRPSPSAPGRTDELTGLANRRALSEALAGRDPGDAGSGAPPWPGWTDRIALLLVGLDSYREINDALGHDTGDQVLAQAGTRLRAALTPPQLIARLGGNEFAVVLPGAGRDAAIDVGRALAAVLADPVTAGGQRLDVRASVGVATCVVPHDQPSDLLRRADVALNRARAAGSGLEVYDPALDSRATQRLRRIDELRAALDHGDLEVYLQPQVDLGDGTVAGAEALARWRHPQDGVLLPDSFLPLAAATGLMRPVAALVLDRAGAACAQWWGQGHRVPVSINLTADDLRDPQLTGQITACLARHGLPPHALCIEITEDQLLTDPTAAAAILGQWRRAGLAVAVDDFGTGYSSLAYLRELPFDELKLDRSFVADLRRRTTLTIVRHTVAMAHGLGMRVVAEGVEDQATARLLAEAGCDLGQGLFFGAPMALPTFLDHLGDPRR